MPLDKGNADGVASLCSQVHVFLKQGLAAVGSMCAGVCSCFKVPVVLCVQELAAVLRCL